MPRICFLVLFLCPAVGVELTRCQRDQASTVKMTQQAIPDLSQVGFFKRPPRKPHPADHVHRPAPP